MRDRALHAILRGYAVEAAARLTAETADGAELRFELVCGDPRPGQVPLYCYRPLTGEFIDERQDLLAALPSHAAAVRALSVVERVSAYLRRRGEARPPSQPRERAELALRALLHAVFAERSRFEFDAERFERAYAELEEALYEGRCVTVVLAPLLGLALDPATDELQLDHGLSLIRADALEEAPPEAGWDGEGQPRLLAMVQLSHDPLAPPPLPLAQRRLRHLLTGLRLYSPGAYALETVGWMRVGGGAWRPIAIEGGGGGGLAVPLPAGSEDELRAFCSLVEHRLPVDGPVAWALRRFELGCTRSAPAEALSDHLLALRALLEPEGPASGRLAWRVAAICAPPDRRREVTERLAAAIALEREVIATGAPADAAARELVDEVAEHLRALLHDIIFGHLESDPVAFADELLGATDDAPTIEQALALTAAAPHSAR